MTPGSPELLISRLSAAPQKRDNSGGMAKQCPQCHTIVHEDSLHCDSCGCQFGRAPAASVSSERILRLLAILALAGVLAFLVWYFRFH